jgi:hypothetical protein
VPQFDNGTPLDYLGRMTHFGNQIVPAEFPELKMLAWNRNPARPIAADEAFALYERNWRFVDRENLTSREKLLIEELTEEYGHGLMLV